MPIMSFRLAALNLVVESHSLTVSAVGVLRVNEIALIAFPGVGVRDVQPERSIRTQNAPDFGKHFRQARDIFLRRCLSADLSLHAVIAERVIRRGRHTAMNAVIGQGFQDFKAIAGMNDVKLVKWCTSSCSLICVSIEMLAENPTTFQWRRSNTRPARSPRLP